MNKKERKAPELTAEAVRSAVISARIEGVWVTEDEIMQTYAQYRELFSRHLSELKNVPKK